jgi:glycosyltransferase involved in cell wall biosynthesis
MDGCFTDLKLGVPAAVDRAPDDRNIMRILRVSLAVICYIGRGHQSGELAPEFLPGGTPSISKGGDKTMGTTTPSTVSTLTKWRQLLARPQHESVSFRRSLDLLRRVVMSKLAGAHHDRRNLGKEQRGTGDLVSVVIPCYNQAHFLAEAIESVLSQSYTGFELIVVDDGSEDDTPEVARRCAAEDPRVRLVRQRNRGLAGARNRGLAASRGEYVVFLDSDDRLVGGALEVGVRELEANPDCAFVSGTLEQITVDGVPTWRKPRAYVKDHYLALLRGNYIGTPAVVMFRRRVFDEVEGFDTSLRACEDYDLYLRIARRFPVHHHGELIAEYRRHGTSMTAEPELMLRSAVAVLRSQRRYVAGDERLEHAYGIGIRFWRDCYGLPLVHEMLVQIKGRAWARAARSVSTLLRYFPEGFTLINARRMEQYRLQKELRTCARELHACQRRMRYQRRQLRAIERGNGDSDRQVERLRSALAEEGREAQRLKRRSRRLTQRLREVDRRVHNNITHSIWRALRRFATEEMTPKRDRTGYPVDVRLNRGQPREERQRAEAGMVSVVIPCYNQARFLGEAIESVLAQRYTNLEIVVVDDGSTDKTSEVVSRYEEVRLIRQENRGQANARNRGLTEAGGDYVVFLNSDDRLLAKALEVGVRELEANPKCAFVCGHYRVVDAEGASLAVPPRPEVGRDHYLSLLREDYITMPACVMYRRWVFEEVGRFDSSVDAAADWDLHLRIARRFPVHYHGELVAEYRQHDANTTTDSALKFRSTLAVLRSQREHLKGNNEYETAYKAGMKTFVEHDGVNLAKDIRACVGEGRWAKAVRGALAMALYSPRVLPLLSKGRLERYRLAEELGTANREIAVRERQNRRLKKRNRRLALEAQSLDWQSKSVHSAGGGRPRSRFFVVGEMKSGTSWTMWMLNSHPEVFCHGEGSFFGRDQEREEIPVYEDPTPSLRNALLNCEGLRIWQSFSWNYWGNQRDIEDDLPDLTRLAVDYYMMQGSATSGKRIVGDKSPLHTDYVDEIFELYPDAKVIHVFRDGRDVAVSLMHHFWTLAKDKGPAGDRVAIYDLEPEERAKRDAYREDPEGFLASGESIFVEERLRQIAARWSRRVSKASRDGTSHFGDNFYQVSYEELLARPQENMKAIFELLGAQADEEVVRRCVEKNSFESMARRPKGREDSGAFLRKGVAGDWRSVFTERDREIYDGVAGETLREFGYSGSHPG